MIIKHNRKIEINSLYPNVDWYNEGNYVIDETKEENKELVAKIKEHAPYMDLVVENGNIVDVIPRPDLRPAPEPEPPPEPRVDEYLLDLDYRVSMLELGL